MAKSILEEELKKAIASMETERREMIRQFQNVLSEKNRIIAEYEIVLRHVQSGLSPNERKPRNVHFHSSPQQLIATILKREPQKWLNRKDIARQAMELDGQEVGDKVPLPQLQSIAGALSALRGKELVEKSIINREDYWRLKSLVQE